MTSETFQEFKESIEASDGHYGIAFQGMRPSFFVDRIRAGFGDLRPFEEVDVFKFRSDEIELLTAFVILGTVLAWDVYVLPPRGDRIVFISHDELFGVIAKTTEVKDAILVTLTDGVLGVFPQ
jgi:hypothetical protein